MRNNCVSVLQAWSGVKEFLLSQIQVVIILIVAVIGDNYEPSYPRNDNHNMTMFWSLQGLLFIVSAMTWKHKPNPERITVLSRPQTEEWKGWMQFAFISYHYYRANSVYNWIRVFVSSYVWMTGYGNYVYFTKTKDYSLERIVSMVIRINYFPMLLSWATGVPLELYYVVPLHTVGFFMTMATCYVGTLLERRFRCSIATSMIIAIAVSLLVHVAFYETKAVNFLELFSHEIFVRFQIDKYSAWVGMLCAFFLNQINTFMAWAYPASPGDKTIVKWCQRFGGALLIFGWYISFGNNTDKYSYCKIHPFIFYLPVIGWLMIRNSSRYLAECHSTFLEFLGQNTLETYVLQFHLLMNHAVQNIPIIIPGSGSDGTALLRLLNMIVCAIVYMIMAIWARRVTVSTQNTVTELVKLWRTPVGYDSVSIDDKSQEMASLPK